MKFLLIKIKKYIFEKLPADSLRRRFARGIFWTIASNIVTQLLAVISSIILARILGKTSFGEYGMINSTVGLFGIFAGMGLGLTSTKYVAEYRKTDPQKAGKVITVTTTLAVLTGGLLGILLFIFAPFLAKHIINAPHLVGTLRIASGLLLFGSINGAQTGVLSGFEAFKTIAWVGVLTGLFSFPTMLIGAYYFNVRGVVAAIVMILIFASVANRIALNKKLKEFNIALDYTTITKEMSIIWKYSIPSMAAGVMVAPVTWAANSILVNAPNGYAELGIFNAANQWKNALMILPSLISMVFIPILSERYGNHDKDSIDRTFNINIYLNCIVTLPFAMIFALFSKSIMSLYGLDFTAGWHVMIIMLLVAILVNMQLPVLNLLAARGDMWVRFLLNLIWAIIFLAIFYFNRNHNAKGMALAFLFSYVFYNIFSFGYRHYIKTRPYYA